MPYRMEWYVPDRVIYEFIWDEQTSTELQEAGAKFHSLASVGQAPVHFIVDARQLKSMPLNMASLRENLSLLRHPLRGWVVYIDSNKPMLNFLAEMAARVLNLKFRHTHSLDDALDFLRLQDPSIDWDTVNPSVTANHE